MFAENSEDILTLTIGRSKATDKWYFRLIYVLCYTFLILISFITITNSYIQRKMDKFGRYKRSMTIIFFVISAGITDALCYWTRKSIILVPKH